LDVLAVAGGDHADPAVAGLVQMDSVLAIEFGACGENAVFVDSVNYELQRRALASVLEIRISMIAVLAESRECPSDPGMTVHWGPSRRFDSRGSIVT
jgi:hypothetical protein